LKNDSNFSFLDNIDIPKSNRKQFSSRDNESIVYFNNKKLIAMGYVKLIEIPKSRGGYQNYIICSLLDRLSYLKSQIEELSNIMGKRKVSDKITLRFNIDFKLEDVLKIDTTFFIYGYVHSGNSNDLYIKVLNMELNTHKQFILRSVKVRIDPEAKEQIYMKQYKTYELDVNKSIIESAHGGKEVDNFREKINYKGSSEKDERINISNKIDTKKVEEDVNLLSYDDLSFTDKSGRKIIMPPFF